jgi:hypothetical protein
MTCLDRPAPPAAQRPSPRVAGALRGLKNLGTGLSGKPR